MNTSIDISNSDATIEGATSEDGWGYFDLVGVGSQTLYIDQADNGTVIESMTNVEPGADLRIVANRGETFLGSKDYYSGGQFRYEDMDNLQSLSIEVNTNASIYVDKELLDHVDGNISVIFGDGVPKTQDINITLPDSGTGPDSILDIDVYGMGEGQVIRLGSFVSPPGPLDQSALSYNSEDKVLHVSFTDAKVNFNIHDVSATDAEKFIEDPYSYIDVESGALFQLPSNGPVCFAKGVLIDTPSGPIAIEALHQGSKVMGHSGIREVRWIGSRTYSASELRTLGRRTAITPIRITANAIADGLPSRDLLVSPWHHLYIDGLLVRAMDLANNLTIIQELHVSEVSYWHIELDRFDVVLAHALYSESWADGGNRDFFLNGDVSALRPEERTRRRASRPAFDHLVVHSGKKLERLQSRILTRAKAMLNNVDLSKKVA